MNLVTSREMNQQEMNMREILTSDQKIHSTGLLGS